MVKKQKILPIVATLALGITAFAGTNNANAYYVVADSTNDVQVCHELDGILAADDVTYTFTLNAQTVDLNLSTVTLGTGSPANTSITSATSSTVVVSMPFHMDATPGTQEKCVHLNFPSSVMNSSATWGDYWVDVSESSSNPTYYPVDSRAQQLGFIYELNTDSNGAPIANGNEYESKFSSKGITAEFASTAVYPKTHITIDKEVRGNYARTDQDFTFTVNITNTFTSDTTYSVKVGNSSKNCNFGADCTFTLHHGQSAEIGRSGNNDQLYVGRYSYFISENSIDYTPSYAVEVNSVLGSPVSGSRYPATGTKVLDDTEHVRFFNEKTGSPSGRFLVIFPFVVLAVAAGITIIAVRKTSKNEKQA
jgi:hypothetical protein